MQLLRKKVMQFIRSHSLFTPGDKVIVAFSGGADSMAMLDILAHLPELPLNLVVAHLNHRLRGDESDIDELFARQIAEKYALPLEISRVDVAAFAKDKGLSLEEAGRDARRTFLATAARKHGALAVALGHHRDDQAETFLLRLVRGAAGSGLTGMQPENRGTLFVRPLLCLDRSVIKAYLHKRSLAWREDASNSDTKFLRNRIRHELLPLLMNYNPSITGLLNQTAEALAADEELLVAVTENAFLRLGSTVSSGINLNIELLKKEPEALRKRLYRRSLSALRGDLRRISSRHLADMDKLMLLKKGSGSLALPFGTLVVREYNSLLITTKTATELVTTQGEITISSCGSFRLTRCRTLTIENVAAVTINRQTADKETVFIDSEQLPFPWTVRSFIEGDRFVPLGMQGRKKVKDLFIDRKIPWNERRNIPILLCNEEIFWVGGVQLAEKARISAPAKNLLCLRIGYS